MQGQSVSFMRSWKMLTGEPGWYKPLIILALLSWVPILGTIAVLGFAYEWARLAAWGVDCPPRRRGIDYGKLLATGGWAFLILISMSIVCSVVLGICFGVSDSPLLPFDFGGVGAWNMWSGDEHHYVSLVPRLLFALVCRVAAGGLVLAAMMRGVVYDGFAAGWRLDRLFQMIVRDPGGFVRLVGVSALGCAIGLVYSWASSILVALAAVSSITPFFGWSDGTLYLWFNTEYLLRNLFTLGPAAALTALVFSAALSFVGSFVSATLQTVAVHAVGMWFRRFDVGRWGVSSDPLPDGVPHDSEQGGPTPPDPDQNASE